jgi:hypothetical protein
MTSLGFVMACVEFGQTIGVPVEITEDGELIIESDYDREAAEAWRELSGEDSDCLEALESWDEAPITFLLTKAFFQKGADVRLAADWAAHSWRWSESKILPEARELLAVARQPLDVGGRKRGVAHRKLEAAEKWKVSHAEWFPWAATKGAGWAWYWAAGRQPFYINYVAGVAENAQDAALSAGGHAAQEAELIWQIGHFVRAANSVEQGKPWPTF